MNPGGIQNNTPIQAIRTWRGALPQNAESPEDWLNKYLVTRFALTQSSYEPTDLERITQLFENQPIEVITNAVEGVGKLRGLRFTPDKAYPSKRIVIFPGNSQSVEKVYQYALYIAYLTHCTVDIYDYRNTGMSDGSKFPNQKDLVDDGIRHITKIIGDGANPKSDILIIGYSLGGSIATATAAHFKNIATLVINTFDKISTVPKGFYKHLFQNIHIEHIQLIQHSLESTSSLSAWKMSLLQLPITLLDLATRTLYLVFSILYDILSLNIASLGKDLLDLAIYPLYSTALLACSLLGALYVFPRSTLSLTSYLIKALPVGESTLERIGNSAYFSKFLPSLFDPAGWSISVADEWEKIKAPKLAFYAPNDRVIDYEVSSLAHELLARDRDRKDTSPLNQSASHFSYPWYESDDSKTEFLNFTNEALALGA